MTREALLHNLRETYELTNQLEQQQAILEKHQHKAKIFRILTNTIKMALLIIAANIFAYFFRWIFGEWAYYTIFVQTKLLSDGAAIFFLIATFSISIYLRKKAIPLVKEARQKINELSIKIEKIAILHQDFLDTYTIGKLIHYLERGMADTLKEALVLYERKEQHNERIEHMYDIANQQAAATQDAINDLQDQLENQHRNRH